MIIDAKGAVWSETEKHVNEAKELGHDGIIILNSRDTYNTWGKNAKKSPKTTVFAWFKPSQAKVALDSPLISRVDRKPIPNTGPNDGTWDEDDDNIRSNPHRRIR